MSRYLFLVLVLNIYVFSMAQWEEECLYNLYIETGYQGTSSYIGLTLSGDGPTFSVCNLKWNGKKGPDYPYFQAGSRDAFQFYGPCLSDVCKVTVLADGSGLTPNWYVKSAEVQVYTTQGAQISPKPTVVKTFSFETLLTLDSPPESLIASATAACSTSSLGSAVETGGFTQVCGGAAA